MEKVFGIDLGTTYSCIAHVDEAGKPVVATNFEGDRTTPSVVCFESPESVIVGKEAKNMLKTDPDKVVSFVKRSMGDPNFVFNCDGNDYRPEEISARVLSKLVKDASESLGVEIKDVVITCPAYFGINEREATQKAGEIAGLNVKAIINEPTAAALTYGVNQNTDQTVLVYDLGGGTFDITMIKVSQKKIEVVVTGGDHMLGGKNWDDALMAYLADKFKEETGVEDDILSNQETFGDLQIATEEAKKTLTAREKSKVSVLYGTDRANIEVDRATFESLTKDLAQRTIDLTNQLLEDAKKKGVSSFDKILMVGGSTKMPQIKAILEQNFSGMPIESFDPDESVAKGAAIYGQQLLINDELVKAIAERTGVSEEDVDLTKVSEAEKQKAEEEVAVNMGWTLGAVRSAANTKITNVISKSFGILAFVNDTKQMVCNLITKQTSLPAEVTQQFGTFEANQTNVEVAVYENELGDATVEVEASKEIGKGLIDGIPVGLPKGSPIKVTFKINEEGRLDIYALETTHNKELNLTIETASVISGEELEQAKARTNAIQIS